MAASLWRSLKVLQTDIEGLKRLVAEGSDRRVESEALLRENGGVRISTSEKREERLDLARSHRIQDISY